MVRELLTPESLLAMLKGETTEKLRVVELFPEDALFHFTPAPPLRPFADMVNEILEMEEGYVRGIATREWTFSPKRVVKTKQELLEACTAVRRRTLVCGRGSPQSG